AVCTTCQVLIPQGSTKSRANTSTLVSHNRTYHSEKTYQARESKMKQGGGKAKQAKDDIVVNKGREERITEGIADFVIVDRQPLNVSTNRLSGDFCALRGLLRTLILARKESAVQTLKEDVLKGLTVTATSDIWTAKTGVPYISLTALWIETTTEQWTLKKATVGCEAFGGSHTATRIQQKLEHMADVVGIKGNIVTMTIDKAANMKKAINDWTGVEWIGCAAHMIKRSVQK
ncbi:unnamed protein product, partial [Discosporangium mesarthrocarpum]